MTHLDVHLPLDALCHLCEGLVNVDVLLGTGLIEHHIVLLCKLHHNTRNNNESSSQHHTVLNDPIHALALTHQQAWAYKQTCIQAGSRQRQNERQTKERQRQERQERKERDRDKRDT